MLTVETSRGGARLSKERKRALPDALAKRPFTLPNSLHSALRCCCTFLAVLSFSCDTKAAQTARHNHQPDRPTLLLSAAWYPEQWPESRWEADLELMQKAHLHVVGVGEFAWTALEPELRSWR